MNEKPLERLNYFNGQRLQAADLKLEQDYHIRVRRWLNRSLYSSGIASGLNVYAIKNQPRVRVTPGLAIDHLGREIILLEEQIVNVVGTHHDRNGSCDGPYLTIRYQEEVIAKEDLSCSVGGNGADRAAWGGPARILAGAVLELNLDLPNEDSGKIPLACLTLAPGCTKIDAVDTGVRRYIGESSASKVKQYALEGVRDIDAQSPARIYFHVRGRQPSSVTLYLRAEKFPSLYYTELGKHKHELKLAFEDHIFPQHVHDLGGISMPLAGSHGHTMLANMGEFAPLQLDPFNPPARFDAFAFTYRPGDPNGNQAQQDIWARHTATPLMDHLALGLSFEGGDHQHTFAAGTGTGPFAQQKLSHVPTAASDPNSLDAGVSDEAARFGPDKKALAYVSGLNVAIDGNDVTESTRLQVSNARPSENWSALGNGQVTHPFVDRGKGFSDSGAGAIRIDYLPGVTLDEGEHYIDLSVEGAGNGGRIHFNLYVE